MKVNTYIITVLTKYQFLKIASEMPVPHSLGKYFSTPWVIEVVKQYKVQDTFRAVSVILRSK